MNIKEEGVPAFLHRHGSVGSVQFVTSNQDHTFGTKSAIGSEAPSKSPEKFTVKKLTQALRNVSPLPMNQLITDTSAVSMVSIDPSYKDGLKNDG